MDLSVAKPGPRAARRTGDALHVETPAGNLDLEPRDRLDPELASLVNYPGAQPQFAGSPEYVATAEREGQTSSNVTATYWTPDLSGKVLEYYRTALPHWQQKREWLGGAEHAWEFIDTNDPVGTRTIRVRAEFGGTTIENTVSPEHEGDPPRGPGENSSAESGARP